MTRTEAELEVLKEAAKALELQDQLRRQMRDNENIILKLCRDYDKASGCMLTQPHHLGMACRARGLYDAD